MSYSDVTGHRPMVFDLLRNAAYARALVNVIRPGITTVMDLGAGLGVHGLNAAKLGAAAVHMVEPAAVLEVARKIAADNDLTNVHFHRCRAEELQLDARVDVLVSVFTGNFLLTEDLLPTLFYTRDRFLAPGGRMLPDRACMEVVPVSAPDYYLKHIDAWHTYPELAAEHGLPALDYRVVRHYGANTLYYDSRKHFGASPLAAPASLMEMDFMTAASARCDSQIAVRVERGGICHGWLGWFRMRLGNEWLSTAGEHESTHWSPVFLPLEEPIRLQAGDELGFALKRPELGDWTWSTLHAGTRQRQSTFLSRPLTPADMLKGPESHQPRLNQRGEAARWLLGQMQGELSTAQLAKRLHELYPVTFHSNDEALRFVRGLVANYSEQ